MTTEIESLFSQNEFANLNQLARRKKTKKKNLKKRNLKFVKVNLYECFSLGCLGANLRPTGTLADWLNECMHA